MMENKLLNKELLIQYKTDLESLPLWKSVKHIDKSDKRSEQYCMKLTSLKIKKCFEDLEQGIPITTLLDEIKMDTEDYWYGENCEKTPILDTPITDLIELFKQFKFENYQEELAYYIKQNVDWRSKDRDFKIFKEHKKGKVYTEFVSELNLTVSAISKINKRVQSSINNHKGRFFEISFVKYLKSLDIFKNCKIVLNGKPGQPDIYIMTKKRELFVLSLKNLELNKDSYAITIEDIKPEYQFAYYNNSFEQFSKVVLYLIVFDSLTERIHVKELNFKKPSNINIHR